jgi:hypothetical protein
MYVLRVVYVHNLDTMALAMALPMQVAERSRMQCAAFAV